MHAGVVLPRQGTKKAKKQFEHTDLCIAERDKGENNSPFCAAVLNKRTQQPALRWQQLGESAIQYPTVGNSIAEGAYPLGKFVFLTQFVDYPRTSRVLHWRGFAKHNRQVTGMAQRCVCSAECVLQQLTVCRINRLRFLQLDACAVPGAFFRIFLASTPTENREIMCLLGRVGVVGLCATRRTI